MKSQHLDRMLGFATLNTKSDVGYKTRPTGKSNMPTETTKPRNELLIGCALLLALLLTRSGITRSHFGTEFNLPDASWAVFWMMGIFTAQVAWPMLLLVACVGVDYFVISAGVSAYCMTPAYPFLIPAYLSLWALGRWSRSQLPLHAAALPKLALSILVGVTSCFLISNTSFYVMSGYFAQMPFVMFAQSVARYWPYYLLHTAIYASVGLVIHYIVQHLQQRTAARSDTSSDH
jgi:hypothetical protein